MLLLFDIDLTLLTTNGAGMQAMALAGRDLHGPTFTAEGVAFAGRLDPLIIDDLLRINGVDSTPARAAEFRRAYAERLSAWFAGGAGARALPGVLDLLVALRERRAREPSLALGVLTGNFEETGVLKLRAAGIDDTHFDVRVWGDASPSTPPRRSDLVPVGIRGYERARRATVPPARVVVLGDTEHDMHAARTHDCRALGVATGRTPAPALAAAGAHAVLEDFSDVARVLRTLDALVG